MDLCELTSIRKEDILQTLEVSYIIISAERSIFLVLRNQQLFSRRIRADFNL